MMELYNGKAKLEVESDAMMHYSYPQIPRT